MFSSTLKRSVTTLAVMAGLLAVAGPAGAASTGNDGARAVGLKPDSNEVAVEGFMDYTDDVAVFSGDAYDNEMGITSHTKPSADGIIAVLSGLNHTDRGSGVAADGGAITGVA